MTGTLLRRLGPVLLGGSVALGLTATRRRRGTAHRLSRADHRHLRPGRQGHGRRLPDVPRRGQEQLRRRATVKFIVEDEQGKPDTAVTKAKKLILQDKVHMLRRRAAGVDRLCARAGQHRRKGRCISSPVSAADDLTQRDLPKYPYFIRTGWTQLAAEPSVRAMGVRARLQEDRRHRRRLCLRLRGCRRLPARVRGLRRPDRPEDLAAARHQGLRAVHPDHQGRRRRDLLAHGRPDVAAIPQAIGGLRQQEAGDRRRHEL